MALDVTTPKSLEHNQANYLGVRFGHPGDLIAYSDIRVNAGTTIVYTVPADKVFYLYNSMLDAHAAVAAWVFGHIYDATPASVYIYLPLMASPTTAGISQERVIPLVLPAGYSVRFVAPGAITAWGTIEGILCDA